MSIIYLICKKSNNFKNKYTGYLIREDLIPNGIIEELKEPQFINKLSSATKVYKLTDKGYNIVKNIFEKQ